MKETEEFNDERWEDLPLPDAQKAWEKMSLLLDQEDRRRRILPWWFWRVGAPALLVLVTAFGAYQWFGTGEKQKAPATVIEPPVSVSNNEKSSASIEKSNGQNNPVSVIPKAPSETTKNESSVPVATTATEKNNHVAPPSPLKKQHTSLPANRQPASISSEAKKSAPVKSKSLSASTANPPQKKKASATPVLTSIASGTPSATTSTADSSKTSAVKKDSVAKKDTLAAPPAAVAALNPPPQKKAPKKSVLTWSGGVLVQRSVALNGASDSASRTVKSNSLRDYLPGVYVRLQKGAWALQAEGFYAVAQPVEPISYSQKTQYDVSTFALNTERRVLQKLYYHQVLLTLNRELLPNWSVGVGVVHNLLDRTITEQEWRRTDLPSGAELIRRQQVTTKGYTDSFFFKSTTGLLLQTDYTLNRLSVGLRYNQSLQPFIRYTRPDGAIVDDRYPLLQAVVRFRLFNSK